MTKKQRQLFFAKVRELLHSLGATQDGDDFILQTKVGKLTLFPHTSKTAELGTVFGRFDDPKAALKLVPCNPYSGKWNHHFFDGWTVETAIQELDFQLRQIL
jgi:hypothetical protein